MSKANLQVTEIESLSNSDWQARKDDAVARGQGNIAPAYIERASSHGTVSDRDDRHS